jgi:hypothetical protein
MAKRPLELFQEPWSRDWSHAALTANTTVKLATVPTGKKLRIDRVWYNNPTGLAADGTNAFMLEIKVGSTVIATVFNTDSGDAGGAALAADTPILVSASTVLSAADVLTAVFTEDGTATLPAGELRIEGRYV